MEFIATLTLLALTALGMGHIYLIYKTRKIMATIQEFQQALADINSATTNIADDIARLTDQLATGGLSADEEAQVLTELRTAADRLRSVADVTPEAPEGEEPPAEG
jgi:hypothetical protein